MKLPTVLNIGDNVVIFGGGKVALRKVKYLSNFTKDIAVIAKESRPLPKHVKLTISSIDIQNISKFIPENTALVVAALSESSMNHSIAEWCYSHHILVNVVDNPGLSTVLFPALSHKSDLNVTVSTSGKCPFLARKIREDIDVWIEEKSRWLEVLGPIRERLVGIGKKNSVLSDIYDNPEIRRMVKGGDLENAKKRAWEIYNVHCKH